MSHVGELKYHIVWCTKYRLEVLKGDVENRLKELIEQKCIANQYELEELEVMPDHVHLFVGAKATESVSKIAAQIKGFASHHLRKEFKHLTTRLPSLWTRSYYAGTVGHVSEESVRRYIENQKTRS